MKHTSIKLIPFISGVKWLEPNDFYRLRFPKVFNAILLIESNQGEYSTAMLFKLDGQKEPAFDCPLAEFVALRFEPDHIKRFAIVSIAQ